MVELQNGAKMCPRYKAAHLSCGWPYSFCFIFLWWSWIHKIVDPLRLGMLLCYCWGVVAQVLRRGGRWRLHPFMNHWINQGVLQSSPTIADMFAINSSVKYRCTPSTSLQFSEKEWLPLSLAAYSDLLLYRRQMRITSHFVKTYSQF